MTGTALVGRDDELAAVRAALERLRAGTGGCMVIEGAAGVGKTRLLDEAARMAADGGAVVAAGRCTELDRVAPLAALLSALRASRPAVIGPAVSAELTTSRGNRFWLLARLAELLEAYSRERPVLLTLDDLQWADELTALAVRMLVPALRTSPVLWLLARRPVRTGSPSPDAVGRLFEDGAVPLPLGPLDETAVVELAAGVLRTAPNPEVRATLARAAGNPFLVGELLAALAAGAAVDKLPESFRAAVDRRLIDLPPDARRLLEAGAVLARPFAVPEAAALLGCDAPQLVDAAQQAVGASILTEDGTELAFRHDLMREVVYGGLAGSVRHVLHRQAVAVLTAQRRPVAEIARHAVYGARRGDGEAVQVLGTAIAEVAPNAPGAAADLAVRLLGLLFVDDPTLAARTASAIRLLAASGRVPEAVELGRRTLAGRLDPAAEAAVRLGMSEALKHDGREAEVLEHTRVALAQPGVPGDTRAALLAIRAHALLFFDDPDAAEAAGAQATELGTIYGETAAVVFAFAARAEAARSTGRLTRAIELSAQAVDAAETGTDMAARQRHPRIWFGAALAAVDRFAEADVAYDQGQGEAEQLGTAWTLPLWHHFRADLRLAAGRLDDAVAEAEAGLRVADALDGRALAPSLLATLIRAAIHRNDLAGAGELMSRADGLGVGRAGLLADDLELARGLLRDAADTPDAAVRALSRVYAALPKRLWLLAREPGTGPQLVRIANRAGEPDLARTAAEASALLSGRNPHVASVVAAAAHAEGLLRADGDLLIAAATAYGPSPRVLARASAQEDAGRARQAAGDRAGALGLLESAEQAYRASAAGRDLARVQRVLRRLGVRRRPAGPARLAGIGWASLTASELRVVRLIANGLTNREVAGQLFLSPHTVDAHLRHAFNKLGVSSRVELTRQVMAHPAAEDHQHS